VQQLLELVCAGLERPRTVTAQVMKHITDNHAISRDSIGKFLIHQLPTLEEFEFELVLAPLFTPTLADQSPVAALLAQSSFPAQRWPELVRALCARPAMAALVTDEDVTSRIPLQEVVVQRYVHRLRLDGSIAAPVWAALRASTSEDPALKAIARRAVWEKPGRTQILLQHLMFSQADCLVSDAIALLGLVETYEPASPAELLARIPHWQNVLRESMNSGAGSKPFFNERVEELHGGGRDQRRQDQSRLMIQEQEMNFLTRLKSLMERT
jgi:hypothetical protein